MVERECKRVLYACYRWQSRLQMTISQTPCRQCNMCITINSALKRLFSVKLSYFNDSRLKLPKLGG